MKHLPARKALWYSLTSDSASGRYIALIIISGISLLLIGLFPSHRIITPVLYILLALCLTVGILYFTYAHTSRPTVAGRILVTLSALNFIASLILPIARLSTLLSAILLIAYAGYCAKSLLLSAYVPPRPAIIYGMFTFEGFCTVMTATRYTFVENHRSLHFWEIPLVLALLLTALTIWFMVKGTIHLKNDSPFERVCLVIVVCFFSFALLTFTTCNLNYALDTDKPTHVPAIVQDKQVSSGEMTRYKLVVTIHGNEIEVEVPRDTYKQCEIGDRVTVDVYGGAFGDAYCYVPNPPS